jgi:hypothetical protein
MNTSIDITNQVSAIAISISGFESLEMCGISQAAYDGSLAFARSNT